MTDIATTARNAALSFEAKVTRHSKRADGGVNIGLAIHPHGIPQRVKDLALGDRLMVVIVELDDNDQPKEEPKPAPTKPEPARARSYAQEAGRLCNDTMFQLFLLTKPNAANFKTAADFVRAWCGVESRKDILMGTNAGHRWRVLAGDYDAWKIGPRVGVGS